MKRPREFRAYRPIRKMPPALAAATLLGLAACANTPDTGPDKPFRTAEICVGAAIPDGWMRINDWRGKGCGVADAASARDRHAEIRLASAAAAPRVKVKAPSDLSRGANAVPGDGPNNWMTIAEIAHARIGRSVTVCAGPVPDGWVETARYWDRGRCGDPKKKTARNVMLIQRVK